MKKIYLSLVIFLAALSFLYAQESKQEQTSPEPFDLPNFIIQGNLQLNVNSGIKQNPEKPKPLSKSELDSLNSLEKQSSQPLPVEPLITSTLENRNIKDGFIQAQFGRFATGQLNAGYGLDFGGYDIYGKTSFEFSDGHVTNAKFSKFDVNLSSDYIAPSKFFIFGGSRTRTEIGFKNNNYNLYANPLALERTQNHFLAKVDVDGNYKGVKFETGAGFSGMQITTNNFDNADNNIFGYLKVNNLWNNFLVSANVLVDLHTLRGNAANFIQADGSILWFTNQISLTGNGGLQWATNSDGIDRGGLLIAGQLEYRMNKLFTVRADIKSGLENRSFTEYSYSNPYISNMAQFDFAYDIFNLNGLLIFHPNEYIGISAGLKARATDRFPIFAPDDTYFPESFGLDYQSISMFQTSFEAYWYLTENDKLIGNLTFTQSSMSDFSDKFIPYIPQMKLSVDFKKKWLDNFGTDFGLDYIGERFADVQNTKSLDSYINLRAEGNYRIYDGLRLLMRMDNLLNSDIFVWEGYRERNVFVSFGIMWQF